jgi:glycerophosphodiester phosphodiesterase
MTLKQPSFPVLFLTEGGVNKMADVRASSLQNAIRFAKNWKLFGIVSDAIPFIKCPRLASVVKASGLACFTYGSANNDPENAKLEIAAGVDAVIVDSVLAVRKELTKYDESLKIVEQTISQGQ